MPVVLDACALIAYLREESGAEIVASLLGSEQHVCYAHAVNLCEVYYDFLRADSQEVAVRALDDLQSVGVIAREDMDRSFWQEAGTHKAKGRISLADSFAVALAQRLDGEVVTSDHTEFDSIAENGICPVIFFR